MLQEEVEHLYKIIHLSCIHSMSGVCVIPLSVSNWSSHSNVSQAISNYLKGNWSLEAEYMTLQLLQDIVSLNQTRVDPVSAKALLNWIAQSFSFIKEWAGVGAVVSLLLVACLFCAWCLCRMRQDHARTKMAIYQALLAVEEGGSPAIWLASLK